MPFIGKQPQVGAYSKLDAITTSATATYNLTLNSGAYYPSSANHLMVSLNGVMQAPQDSFTISGATIIFASTLASTDSIDFIMALGDVLDIGTPSDGTVVTAKIQNAAVTDAKIATGITATKLTGALPAISGAALTGVTRTTSVVNTAGQNWSGVTYTDPDAVGSNPTAKVFPDGTVVGSTDNGSYTKYPNGDLVCNRTISSNSSSNVTWTYPMAFTAVPMFSGLSVGDPDRFVTVASAISGGSSLAFRCFIASSPGNRSSTSCRLQARGHWY